MTCASILSELIIVGGLIALGFNFYGTSEGTKNPEKNSRPKEN